MLNDNVKWRHYLVDFPLCEMNHAMNSTHTNMETSQEMETNVTFKYRVWKETTLIQ